ncbi:hypothetical protein AB0B89_32235 [Sphaerisporangium sp. NPDC049002]|uniref:hypothetical protein n=1 Tax=Sphaerisporangium sp. NPDC049002 TaxID=3155392 RepID=UPI0033DE791B
MLHARPRDASTAPRQARRSNIESAEVAHATARVGNSIHIAITIEEPTTGDLADVYLALFMSEPHFDNLMIDHHRLSPNVKVDLLRELLGAHLSTADPIRTLESTIEKRKAHQR